jgi:hypothetical protein
MVLLTYEKQIIFFMGQKRFGYRKADKEGTRTYAQAKIENPDAGFYRLRHYEGMLLHEVLPFYRPTNPRTIPQQANRSKFADAMSAWSLLTDLEKKPFKQKGQVLQMNGSNVFVSAYMKSH